MNRQGPKYYLDRFIESAGAVQVGKVLPLEEGLGFYSRVGLYDLFRALGEEVKVFSLEAEQLAKRKQHEAAEILDMLAVQFGLDARKLAIFIYNPTTKYKSINNAFKASNWVRGFKPIRGNILITSRIDQIRRVFWNHVELSKINPYKTDSVAIKKMFYGRKKIRDQILKQHGHVFIYGPRRIGKSSLVNDICERVGMRSLTENKQIKKASYVDVSSLSDPDNTLFKEILEQFGIEKADARRQRRIQQLVGRTTNLIQDDATLLEQILKNCHGELIIVLDEVDGWIEMSWKSKQKWATLERLRGMTDNGRARIFLVGYENLMRVVRKPEFPFGGRGEEYLLGPTDKENISKLITEPLDELGIPLKPSREAVIEEIWRQCLGRPNICQEICADALSEVEGEKAARRAISLATIDRISRKSLACITLREQVKRLDQPLARLMAVVSANMNTIFKRREVVSRIEQIFKPKISDIDLAIDALRLRFIWEEIRGEKRFRWDDGIIKQGVREYTDDNGIDNVIADCIKEYNDPKWREDIWITPGS
jgi:hypothetical protein